MVEVALNVLVFVAGLALIVLTVSSAIQTFVLPRSYNHWLTRVTFRTTWLLFLPWVKRAGEYEQRDRVLALFAPTGLLALPVVWLTFVLAGYTAMFWAVGVRPLQAAFFASGSSLYTLGFARLDTTFAVTLSFTEATFGLGLMALLIAYLPTMYNAFSQREAVVTLLEAYAGMPPSPIELLSRTHRIQMLERLNDQWRTWEQWFAQLEESHTSLAILVFFRSPQPNRSWITAAGTILDAAAISLSTVDSEWDPEAALCIRSGYLALRRIADSFRIEYDPDPQPGDGISISREEFYEAYAELQADGVPVYADREQAWRDFSGWRVNYDTVLLALAALTRAPYARWSSDRALTTSRPSFLRTGFGR